MCVPSGHSSGHDQTLDYPITPVPGEFWLKKVRISALPVL